MILCCALVAVAQTARAQNPTIDQQIEVTRQYVPEVEGARKLDYRPRMNDTVMLKPEIDYAIRPTPWRSVFGTEPIAPVGISTAEYARPYPYYLRLGGGYPGQSLLDFAVDKSTRTTRFGVLLNHYGEWQRRQIPVTEGASLMPWTTNDVGIYAGRDFGRQSLDFRADLQLDYFDAFRLTDTRQGYFNQDLDVRIGYGDDFTDLSRFNYRVALSGGIAQLEVGYGRAEVNLGGRVGDGALLGDVIFDGWWTSSEASTGSCDWYVALAPRYEATFGRFGLHAGLGVYVNRYKGIRHAGDETYNDAFITPIDLFYVDADVKLRLPVGFSLEAGVRYNDIHPRTDRIASATEVVMPVGTGITPLLVTGAVGYAWRDKVFVKVGVEYASQRYAATDTNLYVAVPGYVDLWAEVMFKPTRKVGVFVRGGNLLNQTNYRYLVYRALGANVMAGATFSF